MRLGGRPDTRPLCFVRVNESCLHLCPYLERFGEQRRDHVQRRTKGPVSRRPAAGSCEAVCTPLSFMPAIQGKHYLGRRDEMLRAMNGDTLRSLRDGGRKSLYELTRLHIIFCRKQLCSVSLDTCRARLWSGQGIDFHDCVSHISMNKSATSILATAVTV
jgi:hypothetical protein